MAASGKNDMTLRVGAETKDFQKGMDRLQNEVVKTVKELNDLGVAFGKQTISAKQFADQTSKLERKLNVNQKALRGMQMQSKGLGSTLSANAIPATQEFSRIIQDAPYGIQGVANNIQQLTAQFGYLSAKSGGAKNALKAMIGSLWGPAGILLAVSAVTAGLPFLIKAFKSSKDSLEDTKMAVDDLTRAYDRYLERSKDAQTLIDEQTKMQVAQAKLMGASEDEINKITAKGVSKRVAEIGKEMMKRQQLIEKYTEIYNNLFDKGGEDNLKLIEEYGLEIDKLNRKNEESRIDIQKLGNTIVLNNLAESLRKKEELYKKSEENIRKILFDTPSFGAMGVGTFDNRGGGSFSGMFAGLFDLETPEFVKSAGADIVAAVETTNDELEVAANNSINIGNNLASAFADFGSSWGQALANGKGFVENAGVILISAVGDILVALGRATIAAGIGMLALKSVFANPLAAIVAGTAMVALGSLLKAKMTNITSGIGSGSSSSVGGSGSSSFSGSSSSATSSSSGGGTYVFEIEGTKLVGVLSNTLNRNRALGGSLGF